MRTTDQVGRDTPPARPGATVVAIRAALVVLGLLVVAAGTFSVVGVLAVQTRRSTTTYQAAGAIDVEVASGDVRLVGSDRRDIRVDRTERYSWPSPLGADHLDGGTLRLEGRCHFGILPGGNCGVDYRVELPAGTRVVVHTGSGDVVADGLRAGATLRTGSGEIRARDIAGGLVAGTRSGDVVVDGVAGRLAVDTGSGDVIGGGLAGPTVEAATRSGDVRLTATAVPGRVLARTGSGDIRVNVPDAVYRVDATSRSGDVRVALRQDPAAANVIDATTRSGDVDVDRG